MRILDLFCGAGGAAMGYHLAGFEVVGVDIEKQPNYPFEFWRCDAIGVLACGYLEADGDYYDVDCFDAIHASPPCQAYSTLGTQQRGRDAKLLHPALIEPTRKLLEKTGLPYVIENVVGSPLVNPVKLCGSSFGLDLRRHRLFETNWEFVGKECKHSWQTPRWPSFDKRKKNLMSSVQVYGGPKIKGLEPGQERAIREKAMGIDWMSWYELTQAIPPVYTEFIGLQLREHIYAVRRGETVSA